jgi:hypothetical protein
MPRVMKTRFNMDCNFSQLLHRFVFMGNFGHLLHRFVFMVILVNFASICVYG